MFSEAGQQGCTPCAAGKAADDTTKSTGICVDCVAGQVSSSDTGLKCAACEIGMYQNKPGLPSCDECIPGQYQDDEGKTKCKECQEGRHDTAESAGSDGKQNQVAEIKRDKPTVCEECEFKCFFP